VRLAYDNADTWVRWRATSYLDLHGEDADDLDERIDAYHAWHRANALPQYAKLSEEAATRIARGLSREDIVWGYDSFMTQVRESLRAAAERVAPVLDRLTPEQIDHVEERFAEDNRKFAKEFLRGSEQQRRARRLKRTQERLEDWVGPLSEPQAERVRQYAESAPLFDDLRDRDRKRLQAQFLAMVRAHEARQRLPDAALAWERGREPAYAAASAAFRREYFALLIDLDSSLSPEQRARAAARFRSYGEDFATLARAGAEQRPQ